MMKLFFKCSSLTIAFLLISYSLIAQDAAQQTPEPGDFTDQELVSFVSVTDSFQTIQQNNQQKIREIVKEEGMDFSRFRNIMMSRQNPQSAQQVNVTAEEEKLLENIQPELMKMNQETQQKFVAIIQDEGLTTERFQQILQVARTDQEFAQRLQQIQKDNN